MIECPDCGTRFEVIFHATPIYDHIEYCPFCGRGFTKGELRKFSVDEGDEQ